jgi:hypothetical protein
MLSYEKSIDDYCPGRRLNSSVWKSLFYMENIVRLTVTRGIASLILSLSQGLDNVATIHYHRVPLVLHLNLVREQPGVVARISASKRSASSLLIRQKKLRLSEANVISSVQAWQKHCFSPYISLKYPSPHTHTILH